MATMAVSKNTTSGKYEAYQPEGQNFDFKMEKTLNVIILHVQG